MLARLIPLDSTRFAKDAQRGNKFYPQGQSPDDASNGTGTAPIRPFDLKGTNGLAGRKSFQKFKGLGGLHGGGRMRPKDYDTRSEFSESARLRQQFALAQDTGKYNNPLRQWLLAAEVEDPSVGPNAGDVMGVPLKRRLANAAGDLAEEQGPSHRTNSLAAAIADSAAHARIRSEAGIRRPSRPMSRRRGQSFDQDTESDLMINHAVRDNVAPAPLTTVDEMQRVMRTPGRNMSNADVASRLMGTSTEHTTTMPRNIAHEFPESEQLRILSEAGNSPAESHREGVAVAWRSQAPPSEPVAVRAGRPALCPHPTRHRRAHQHWPTVRPSNHTTTRPDQHGGRTWP